MQEVDFAWAVLRMVRAWLELGAPVEAVRRVILSRLYYAAHHVARLMLRQVGLNPVQWRDVHMRVRRELYRHYVRTGRMSRRGWRALDRLRRLRVRANYHPEFVIQDEDMRRALDLFMLFFDECRHILGVT